MGGAPAPWPAASKDEAKPTKRIGAANKSDKAILFIKVRFIRGIPPPAEGHAVVVEADEPVIGDADAAGVAAEIGDDLLGSGNGRLGVDEPIAAPEPGQDGGEGPVVGEPGGRSGKKHP